MSNSMMVERSMSMGGTGMAGMGMPMGMPSMAPMANMCMVPRCTMKMEKCAGGMKITCTCEDEVSCATLQNMCKMMAGGMCSCCCMMNGMLVCQCNLTMCMCKCEMTEDGICVTCTSGDKTCCKMVQACCECMSSCMDSGCTCCLCFNGNPVCCAC